MIEFRKIWYYLTRYIDGLLLAGILTLMLVGLIVLYSATGANINKVSQYSLAANHAACIAHVSIGLCFISGRGTFR